MDNLDKPLFSLTVAEFEALLQKNASAVMPVQVQKDEPRLVYGLRGLRQLLNVSHTTAQKMKDSEALKGCFSQAGKKLIFDADMVLERLRRV